jgi:hypothetical protein
VVVHFGRDVGGRLVAARELRQGRKNGGENYKLALHA